MKSKSNRRSSLAFPLAAAIAALLAVNSVQAAVITWDANAATALQTDGAGVWLAASQWWDGAANVAWTSGDDAIFGNAGAGGAVTLASPTTINSLTFNSFTGTYTLGTAAQTITLTNGITKNAGGTAATIVSPITLSAAQSWTNNSAGLLTIGTGAVTNAGFLLTLGGTGNSTVSSVISGLGGLTKSAAGLITLSGANTYGGATTINGGVLAISTLANGGAASNIGNSSNAVTNLVFGAPTATLRYTGSAVTTDRGFTLSSGAGGGATIEASGTGALTLNNTVPIAYGTVDETRTLTLGGTNTLENNFGKVLADNGTAATSLVKAGAGTWLLTVANTYTGGSTVSLGSLVFRTLAAKPATGTHAFGAGTTIGLGVGGANFTATDVDNAFSGALGGNLSNVTVDATTSVGIDTTAGSLAYATDIGSVTKGLTKFGVNTLTLSGTNSAYTGATTITGGTLSVASVAAAGLNSSIGAFATTGITGLVINSSTLIYTGATATTDRGFTVNGNSTINVTTAATKLTLGSFTMNATNTTLTASGGVGSSLDLGTFNYNFPGNQNITTNIPVSLASIVTTVGNGLGNTGGSLLTIGNVSGTGFFLGGGQILITGTVNLSGNLNNNASSGTITYTGNSFTLPFLRLLNGNTFAVGGSGTIGTGGILTTNMSVRDISTFKYDSSANQTITGNIFTESANGGKLTMSGTGSLTLTGANTYLGVTTVSNGILKFGKQASLYNNTPASWTAANLNVQSGGTLAFNVGGTGEFTIGDVTTLLTNLAASSSATNGMNAGSRFGFDTTNAAGGTFTIADVIADSTGANGGARGLTKLGIGSLVLTGANTYSGNTIASAGTLELADNAQLKFVLGATSGSNNSMSGAGTVSLEGDFVIDTAAADALPSGTWTLENVSFLSGAYGANFTVVGFTNAGSDKWTKVNGTKIYTFDETTGILALAAGGSAYDTWKAANAPGSNPDDDTDGDGVDNAVEFVLGGTSLTNDLDKLPVASAGVTDLTLTFKRAISSIDPKTALFIETSTDLITWNTAPSPYTVPDATIAGPPVTVVEDTPVGFDTVTLTVPKAPDAKKFARLKVVITP